MELYAFSSGTKLLEQEKLLAKCQAVFLDINMQDCSGLDIAFQIKQKNPDILLIFVTAYMDYVLAGYQAEAFRFLLKDDLEAMMRECIWALPGKKNRQGKRKYFSGIFRRSQKYTGKAYSLCRKLWA